MALLIGGLCCAALAVAGPADADAPPGLLIPYGAASWSYLETPAGAGPIGFEAPAYPDQAWAVGQAGFGQTDSRCTWNNIEQVKTAWISQDDLFLRKHFMPPVNATAIRITGYIDNTATLYLNGIEIGQIGDGYCQASGIDITVPVEQVAPGDNVLAVRATDDGGSNFIDLQVTAVPSTRSTPQICLGGRPDGKSWAFEASVSDTDGVVLQNARLGPRLAFESVSLPYFVVSTDVGTYVGELTSPSFPGRSGVSSYGTPYLNSTLRSLDCNQAEAAGTLQQVTATYDVNGLPSGVQLSFTERYIFASRVVGDHCEPTGETPCARFWPSITWSASTAGPGFPRVSAVEFEQRINLRPDNLPLGVPELGSDQFNASTNPNVLTKSVSRETKQAAIGDGKVGAIDHFHFSGTGNVELPGLSGSAGCPECVHAHWHWSTLTNRGGGINLPGVHTHVGGSSGFTDGRVAIPDGSTQDAEIGAVAEDTRNPDEADPVTGGWQSLVNGERLKNRNGNAVRHPVLWWSVISSMATGKQSFSDGSWPYNPSAKPGDRGSMWFAPAQTRGCKITATPDTRPTQTSTGAWLLKVKLTPCDNPGKSSILGRSDDPDDGPFYLMVGGATPLNAETAYSSNPLLGQPFVEAHAYTPAKSSNAPIMGDIMTSIKHSGASTYLLFADRPDPSKVHIQVLASPTAQSTLHGGNTPF